MAKSFLEEQILGVAEALKSARGEVQGLTQDSAAMLAQRASIGSGAAQRIGAPDIASFLGDLAAKKARDANNSSSSTAPSTGSHTLITDNPASEEEKSMMGSLGESLEYVRKLMAAAKWARISPFLVLRAPKSERDALIAAYEEYVESSSVGSSHTQGTLNLPDPINPQDKYGTRVFIGGGGDPGGGMSGPSGGGSSNPLGPPGTGGSWEGGGSWNGGGSWMGSQSGPIPQAKGPSDGDRFVADAVVKAVNKLADKIDSGAMAMRMKGL